MLRERKKYFKGIGLKLNIDFWPKAIDFFKDFLQDLPMVCFVVTQHSESELSLCLRYSKTSCEAIPNIIFNEKSLTKMRSNTSLSGRIFMGIAYGSKS